jgi:hypothetical protein
MTIERYKRINTDGTEHECIHVGYSNYNSPEAAEQFGRDLLQAAGDWRAEIEARGPPGLPAYKVFEFARCYGGTCRVASWIERPWALVHVGRGTSTAFLVKAGDRGSFKAWIVSVKLENHEHRWKCRYEYSSTIEARDLIEVFPYTLPDSPTLGDIESAREKARALVGVAHEDT